MAPYLVLGFVLAGILHAFVPRAVVARHLGGESMLSAVKAAIVGVPLPLCSCGVVPTGIGLLKRGASRAATVSFLISTPQTGVDSIAVTYGFFGWMFAIFRPLAAFLSGILGGFATLLLKPQTADQEHWLTYHVKGEDALEQAGAAQPFSEKMKSGFRFAFYDLLGDISNWLLVGLAVATLIGMFVPEDFFAGRLGHGVGAMLIMMAFGIPLYVCSTASIPIAAMLMAKGLSAGAAFVFLMTGPATNAATILIIGRVMGWRVLWLYLGSIALLALGFGLGLDALLAVTGWQVIPKLADHLHGGSLLMVIITWACAGLLTYFVTLHSYNKLLRRFARGTSSHNTMDTIKLDITGMNCSHCVRAVNNALKEVNGVTQVEVTLADNSAVVHGDGLDRELLAKAVAAAGYEVKG
jgi:uncharacterized membrane protein YraQ (UPF0718 family)/copper chaperone CopZ